MASARASAATCFGLVRPSIRQALARNTGKRNLGTRGIVDPELRAVVHAEIKLGEIAVQVLLVHVLVGANESALEDAEVSFQGVGMNIAA